jgi:hypothetical protein
LPGEDVSGGVVTEISSSGNFGVIVYAKGIGVVATKRGEDRERVGVDDLSISRVACDEAAATDC